MLAGYYQKKNKNNNKKQKQKTKKDFEKKLVKGILIFLKKRKTKTVNIVSNCT